MWWNHCWCPLLFAAALTVVTGLQETGDVEVVYSWDKVGVKWPDSITARRHGRKMANVIGIKVLLKQ